MAEQILEKAQVLPESLQKVVLDLLNKLSKQDTVLRKAAPKAGSAKGVVHVSPDFDKPLADFKPYME